MKPDLIPVLKECLNALKCARQQLAGSKALGPVHASSLRCDLLIVDQAIVNAKAAIETNESNQTKGLKQ
jgi:hypothetical protein